MVQFGLSGNPATNAEWRAKTITDDPVVQTNKPGFVTFAKTGAPNSRTSQLFINYVDNARLDEKFPQLSKIVRATVIEPVKDEA